MSDPFTPAELDLLSAEIDLQLRTLHSQGAAPKRGDLRTEALVRGDFAHRGARRGAASCHRAGDRRGRRQLPRAVPGGGA